MNKYKVVVYAIAKNEEKNAEKWAKNMSEADEIYVLLDPTSTDKTKEILEKNGVFVKEKLIRPWRFDKARNESLKLVPKDTDICVCTDLDELFSKGWRAELEKAWQKNTNQACYPFYHNANSPSSPKNIFTYSKIHDRNSFYWKWPIHEYIVAKHKKHINQVNIENIMLYHYPDNKKGRNYKQLLEFAVKENKKDIRCLTLLTEEYVNSKDYDKAKNVLDYTFNLKNLKQSQKLLLYKFLVTILYNENKYKEAISICYLALSINPDCRHFYGELGKIQVLHTEDINLGIENLKKCKTIKKDVMQSRETEWKDEALIYNIISIGEYNLKNYKNAIKYIDKALKIAPNEECYIKNKQLYLSIK